MARSMPAPHTRIESSTVPDLRCYPIISAEHLLDMWAGLARFRETCVFGQWSWEGPHTCYQVCS